MGVTVSIYAIEKTGYRTVSGAMKEKAMQADAGIVCGILSGIMVDVIKSRKDDKPDEIEL